MTLCGSRFDKQLLGKFVINGRLVRHPTQSSNGNTGKDFRNWTDHKETSRDQLICFAAGCGHWFYPREVKDCLKYYANSWFINKDILLPHYRLALYVAARVKPPLHIKLFGYPLLYLHIVYQSLFKPDAEHNQTIALLAPFGDWWTQKFVDLCPDYAKALQDYWCGYPWRDQKEIYEAIIQYMRGRS
jgi:hypothetical protein